MYRSIVNQCSVSFFSLSIECADGSTGFTAEELEEGATRINRSLDGDYKDPKNS